jgi:hypothetical protein
MKPMAGSIDERKLWIARSARAEATWAEKKFPAESRFHTRTRAVAYCGSGDLEGAEVWSLVSLVSASPALNASPW